MNIQIFGTKKDSETRKAERYFKERGIKFQSIDMNGTCGISSENTVTVTNDTIVTVCYSKLNTYQWFLRDSIFLHD